MTAETHKPVILLTFANSPDEYLRSLANEAHQLRDVLESGECKSWCDVVLRENCTPADIFKVLQDPQYRNRIALFHFGGHANAYQLLMESPEGKAIAADGGGIATFLGQQEGLQLVFLNGCSTQQQTRGLLDAGIPAVITTSRDINDEVATTFSLHFYQAIAGGATIRTAYIEAEASVQKKSDGSNRSLYFGKKQGGQPGIEPDRLPWELFLRDGSEQADQWNLPDIVDDPLFGLPALTPADLPFSPYRHLHWFARPDAEVFFGRGHQIRELYDRLTAPRTPPILLFYGQSGVGKSSLLDAGLMPRLERDYEVRYLRRNEAGLLDTLRLAFLPEAAGVAETTAWELKETQTGKPLIVFLDQVEEVFTRPIATMPEEWSQFLDILKGLFREVNRRPQGKLVLGFRKEWLAEIEAKLTAAELPRTKVFLEPLEKKGIIQAIVGPTRNDRLRQQYGLTIEPGLAELIADDLLEDRDSAIAPTLQILLTKLWSKATESNYEHPAFTQDLYHQLKRDGILLRDFLSQQIATFRERFPEAVDSGLLLDIIALHTTPLGTADQRTVSQLQQQYAHLSATLPDLIQQCQDLHLLTVTANSELQSDKTTRLAHDTLAPLVREQFDTSDKPGQRARRILDNRSVDWTGDSIGTPLDVADLKLVESGITGTRNLTATEARLLTASRELQRRNSRLSTFFKIAGAVAVAIILAISAIAIQKSTEATQANLTTLLTAAPLEVPRALESIHESMAPVLREIQADTYRSAATRLHATYGLAHLGQEQDEFLVNHLAYVSPDEMENYLRALSQSPDALTIAKLSDWSNADICIDPWRNPLADRNRLPARTEEPEESPIPITTMEKVDARPFAIPPAAVLLALGRSDRLLSFDMKNTNGYPNLRTDFIGDYHRWIGDAQRLQTILDRAEQNAAALAAICLSLGHSRSKEVVRATQVSLTGYAIDQPHAAVRAAARSTLTKWGILPTMKLSSSLSDANRDWVRNSLGMTLVEMPFDRDGVGRFTWQDLKNQGTPLPVDLKRRYLIADTEVTVGEWMQWPERPQRDSTKTSNSQQPVGNVTFYDAIEFCNWLSEKEQLSRCYTENESGDWVCDFQADGYRLPTEAEWRFACRGGSNTRYCFGDDPQLATEYAWTNANSHGAASNVAMLMPNAYGLFDMHGNLLEWCWDWYAPVPSATDATGKVPVDYAGPEEPLKDFPGRVACGGDYLVGAELCIADDRGVFGATTRQDYLGFRVSRTIVK